jgi:hypothetical protein
LYFVASNWKLAIVLPIRGSRIVKKRLSKLGPSSQHIGLVSVFHYILI